jgi:hypothetical protein
MTHLVKKTKIVTVRVFILIVERITKKEPSGIEAVYFGPAD